MFEELLPPAALSPSHPSAEQQITFMRWVSSRIQGGDAKLQRPVDTHDFKKPGRCWNLAWNVWEQLIHAVNVDQWVWWLTIFCRCVKQGNNKVITSRKIPLRVILPHRNILARHPTKKGPVTLKHFQTSTERYGKASGQYAIFKADGFIWFIITTTAAESR